MGYRLVPAATGKPPDRRLVPASGFRSGTFRRRRGLFVAGSSRSRYVAGTAIAEQNMRDVKVIVDFVDFS
jgi:hypothetical protein